MQKLLLVFLLAASSIYAKNLENRNGFGVSLHDFDQTPSVSMRHHFSAYSSGTLMVGFNSKDANRTILAGGKIYQHAHLEENMNFYVGLGAFFLSHRDTDLSVYSGFELEGLVGGEFFFAGLPNLGFQFETGVALRTVKETVFKTLGGGFLGVGVHYYF